MSTSTSTERAASSCTSPTVRRHNTSTSSNAGTAPDKIACLSASGRGFVSQSHTSAWKEVNAVSRKLVCQEEGGGRLPACQIGGALGTLPSLPQPMEGQATCGAGGGQRANLPRGLRRPRPAHPTACNHGPGLCSK